MFMGKTHKTPGEDNGYSEENFVLKSLWEDVILELLVRENSWHLKKKIGTCWEKDKTLRKTLLILGENCL